MHQLHIRSVAAAVTFAFIAGWAQAEGPYQREGDDNRGGIGSVCTGYYPIFATGSACYGPNVGNRLELNGRVNCCIAAPSTQNRRSSIPSQRIATPGTGRAAAAIEGAAALVQIIAALVEMFDSTSGTVAADEPEDPRIALLRREKAGLVGQAAEFNRIGIDYIKRGDDRTAAGYFSRALSLAEEAGDLAAAAVYRTNVYNAVAQDKLKEAIRLESEGFFYDAYQKLDQAMADAAEAGRPDLVKRIKNYAKLLTQKNAKLPPSERKFLKDRECTRINGQYICN